MEYIGKYQIPKSETPTYIYIEHIEPQRESPAHEYYIMAKVGKDSYRVGPFTDAEQTIMIAQDMVVMNKGELGGQKL